MNRNGKHRNNRTLFGILAGIVAGTLLGGFFPETGLSVQFAGKIFIRLLMMIVMPLIIAAMISGIARLGDIRKLGTLGSATMTYFLSTTAIAVGTGILLVLFIRPGVNGNSPLHLNDRNFKPHVSSADRNPESTFADTTVLKEKGDPEPHPAADTDRARLDKEPDKRFTQKERNFGEILKEMATGLVPSNIFKAMADNDILPVITFSLLLGAALSMTGEKGKPVIDFFIGLNDAMMTIIHLIMYAAPFGIGALIAGRLGESGGFGGFWPELLQIGKYIVTVIAGLLIHSLFTLPLLLKIFGRTPPGKYALNTAPALLTAFSSASSSATLPVTMECAEQKNGISERTAGFVLPLGATLNMDGTALYEAVAVIFIAQANSIALGPVDLMIVFLTATLASIGAAGIPEAGLVTMVMVLKAVNLPVEGIAMILAVDWFLDRCRTTVNVWGDCIGAKIIDLKERSSLPEG
ncbi:MAG: dicarboxylate/amino acid:cation symporter [Chlorobiaceae bacterium]|nr:dicarboxylate/amino acid:cation symporter [Chlorobiaceae bacterium]NTV61110.1 dicarboxylate/amino acid:cation symporter [Chlorobiaceae bacterium]